MTSKLSPANAVPTQKGYWILLTISHPGAPDKQQQQIYPQTETFRRRMNYRQRLASARNWFTPSEAFTHWYGVNSAGRRFTNFGRTVSTHTPGKADHHSCSWRIENLPNADLTLFVKHVRMARGPSLRKTGQQLARQGVPKCVTTLLPPGEV